MNVNVGGCGDIDHKNAYGKGIVAARVNAQRMWPLQRWSLANLFVPTAMARLSRLQGGPSLLLGFKTALEVTTPTEPLVVIHDYSMGFGEHLDTTVVTTDQSASNDSCARLP